MGLRDVRVDWLLGFRLIKIRLGLRLVKISFLWIKKLLRIDHSLGGVNEVERGRFVHGLIWAIVLVVGISGRCLNRGSVLGVILGSSIMLFISFFNYFLRSFSQFLLTMSISTIFSLTTRSLFKFYTQRCLIKIISMSQFLETMSKSALFISTLQPFLNFKTHLSLFQFRFTPQLGLSMRIITIFAPDTRSSYKIRTELGLKEHLGVVLVSLINFLSDSFH